MQSHHPHPKTKPLRIALLGSDTLLGRELQEVFESRKVRATITSYTSTGDASFGEQDGEAVYVEPLTAEALDNEDAVVIAGSEDGAKKVMELLAELDSAPMVIDCSGFVEHQPEGRIVAPLVNGNPVSTGVDLLTLAHPAATALALVLTRLGARSSIKQALAEVFEPATERGKRGAAEMHQQTSSLLAFKTLDKDVFDTQVSFTMLPHYGPEAKEKLLQVEQRIERHLASLLGNTAGEGATPMPSLRLIQAPVFHGYSISLWVELAEQLSVADIAKALASDEIEIRLAEDEPPTNVAAVGQSGVLVGDIRVDRNRPRAVWLWIAADNLRIPADAVADLLTQPRTLLQ